MYKAKKEETMHVQTEEKEEHKSARMKGKWQFWSIQLIFRHGRDYNQPFATSGLDQINAH